MNRIICEHAERCGGCPLIDLAYDEQLVHKRLRVEAAVARYPELPLLRVASTRAADPVVGYRTRAKLIVAPGGRVGLYAKGGEHEVLDVPHCRVLSPAFALVADAIRARVKRDEEAGGALGGLRAIDLREVFADGSAAGVLVTLVVERSPAFRLEAFREAAASLREAVPSIRGVAANLHEGASPQILGAETIHLHGERGAFGAFTQAHRGQAAAILAEVADAVLGRGDPAPPRVLDLYGGSGAFALPLAARGAEVVLVESFAPAAAQAAADATKQGLRVETLASDVTRALTDLSRRHRPFDAAVVNPPRRGVHPSARQALASLGPETIAYVSCDPETLARDLDHLARLGFRATELLPFDMIPLTGHVETLAVLRRAAAPAPRALYEDDDVIAIVKSPHEPTTPQGEHTTSLTRRVQQHLASEAVPIHRLDVGTSGVVLFARTPSRVAPWSRALGASSAHTLPRVPSAVMAAMSSNAFS